MSEGYEVPSMTLIPQQKDMSCWYASAQMLIQWKMDILQQCLADLVPPELDAQCEKNRGAVSDGAGQRIEFLCHGKTSGVVRRTPHKSDTPGA